MDDDGEHRNNLWPIGGALFGAMMGLFAAKSFTDSTIVHLAASMAGSVLGILASFLVPARFR